MSDYKLSCNYDSRKSFYGKATVIEEEDGRVTLRSYTTNVAYIENDKAYVRGSYSVTTIRHIKEFLKQYNFLADTQAQILKDYALDREKGAEIVKKDDDKISPLGQHIKSVTGVCAIGELLCNTQKEKNAWNKRMINTLPGASFPDDWDTLSEKEKQRRLEGGISALKEKHN